MSDATDPQTPAPGLPSDVWDRMTAVVKAAAAASANLLPEDQVAIAAAALDTIRRLMAASPNDAIDLAAFVTAAPDAVLSPLARSLAQRRVTFLTHEITKIKELLPILQQRIANGDVANTPALATAVQTGERFVGANPAGFNQRTAVELYRLCDVAATTRDALHQNIYGRAVGEVASRASAPRAPRVPRTGPLAPSRTSNTAPVDAAAAREASAVDSAPLGAVAEATPWARRFADLGAADIGTLDGYLRTLDVMREVLGAFSDWRHQHTTGALDDADTTVRAAADTIDRRFQQAQWAALWPTPPENLLGNYDDVSMAASAWAEAWTAYSRTPPCVPAVRPEALHLDAFLSAWMLQSGIDEDGDVDEAGRTPRSAVIQRIVGGRIVARDPEADDMLVAGVDYYGGPLGSRIEALYPDVRNACIMALESLQAAVSHSAESRRNRTYEKEAAQTALTTALQDVARATDAGADSEIVAGLEAIAERARGALDAATQAEQAAVKVGEQRRELYEAAEDEVHAALNRAPPAEGVWYHELLLPATYARVVTALASQPLVQASLVAVYEQWKALLADVAESTMDWASWGTSALLSDPAITDAQFAEVVNDIFGVNAAASQRPSDVPTLGNNPASRTFGGARAELVTGTTPVDELLPTTKEQADRWRRIAAAAIRANSGLLPSAASAPWLGLRDEGFFVWGWEDAQGGQHPLPWALMGTRSGYAATILDAIGVPQYMIAAAKLRNDSAGRIVAAPKTLRTVQAGHDYPDTAQYTYRDNQWRKVGGAFMRSVNTMRALQYRWKVSLDDDGVAALDNWLAGKGLSDYVLSREPDAADDKTAILLFTPWWLRQLPADRTDLLDTWTGVRPGAVATIDNPWYVDSLAGEALRMLLDPSYAVRARDRAVEEAAAEIQERVLGVASRFSVEDRRLILRRAIVQRANATPWTSTDVSQIPLVRRPPLSVAGAMVPDPHQNEGTRLAERVREGIVLAYDVGVGKTLTAVQTVAALRQRGGVRLPVVVLPNPLVLQWLATIRRVLPDYRIGVIGVVPDNKPVAERRAQMARSENPLTRRPFTPLEIDAAMRVGGVLPMKAEERVAVWAAAARGAFDIVLCTETAFAKAGASPDMVRKAIAEDPGIRRWTLSSLAPVSTWSAWKRYQEKAPLTPRPGGGSYDPRSYDDFKAFLYDTAARLMTEGNAAAIEDAKLIKKLLTRPFDSDTPLPGGFDEILDEYDLVTRAYPGGRTVVVYASTDAGVTPAEADAMLTRPPELDPVWIGSAPGPDVPPSITAVPVDMLVLDEAHRYKGLFTAARRGYLRGGVVESLHSSDDDNSSRALRMFGRARVVQHCGGRVLSLTATPAKVSPIELYTAMALVAPKTLDACGVGDPERFLSMFLRFGATLLAKASGNIIYSNYVVAPDRDMGFLRNLMATTVMVRNVNDVERLSRLIAQGTDGTTIRSVQDADNGTSRLRTPTMDVRALRTLAEQTRIYLHVPTGNVAGNYTITDFHDGGDGSPPGLTVAPPFAVDQPQVDWQIRDASTMPIAPPIIRDVVELTDIQRALYDAVAANYAEAVQAGASIGYAAVPNMINLATHPVLATFAVAGAGSGAAAARFDLAAVAPKAQGVGTTEADDDDDDASAATTDDSGDEDDDFGVAGGKVIAGQVSARAEARGWTTMLSRCLRQGEPLPVGVNQALDEVDPADSPKLLRCAQNLLTDLEVGARTTERGPVCGHIVFADGIEVHAMLYVLLTRLIRARRHELEVEYRKAGISPSEIATRLHHLDPQRVAVLNGPATTPATRQVIAEAFNGVYTVEADGSVTAHAPAAYDVLIANRIAYEGLDLQRRTCSIHHLDLPWEPASFIQRNGRGVRQGNLSEMVQIRVYLADGTLDFYRLRRVEGRRGWFAGIVSGSAAASRTIDASKEAQIEAVLSAVPPSARGTYRALLETRFASLAREEAALDAQAFATKLAALRQTRLDRWRAFIGQTAANTRIVQLRILLHDLLNAGNLPVGARWAAQAVTDILNMKVGLTPQMPYTPPRHDSAGPNARGLVAGDTPIYPGRIYLGVFDKTLDPTGEPSATYWLVFTFIPTVKGSTDDRQSLSPLWAWAGRNFTFVALPQSDAARLAYYVDITDALRANDAANGADIRGPIREHLRGLVRDWHNASPAYDTMHDLLQAALGAWTALFGEHPQTQWPAKRVAAVPPWLMLLLPGFKPSIRIGRWEHTGTIDYIDVTGGVRVENDTYGGRVLDTDDVNANLAAAKEKTTRAYKTALGLWQQREAARVAYVAELAAWTEAVRQIEQADALAVAQHEALVAKMEAAHAKDVAAAVQAGEEPPEALPLPAAPKRTPRPKKPAKKGWLKGDPTLPLPQPQLVFPPVEPLREHTLKLFPFTQAGFAELREAQYAAFRGECRSALSANLLVQFGLPPSLQTPDHFRYHVTSAVPNNDAIRAWAAAQAVNVAVNTAPEDDGGDVDKDEDEAAEAAEDAAEAAEAADASEAAEAAEPRRVVIRKPVK